MIRSRELDRLEVEHLTPQGKVKYQFSTSGHELAQILLAQALNHPHDAAAVYYRSRAFMLACGLRLDEALAAGMALTGSPSEGRDVGVVYNLPRRSGPTILPSSGNVGAQYTPAAGWAHAIHYRQRELGEAEWSGAIAVALGGDGSVAANGFWAALNIVTTQHLPYLFFIEDNSYGLSVPSSLQVPGGNIAANLTAYSNLLVLDASGVDPQETWNAIAQAVGHVRGGSGPCLLRVRVPRLAGHTFVDDQSYKNDEQRQDELQRDPLPRMQAHLNLSNQAWERLVQEAQQDLAEALRAAEGRSAPTEDGVRRHLFYEGLNPVQGGLRPEKAQAATCPETKIQTAHAARLNLIDAVRRTMEHEMQINPRMVVFGEDVGVKGGVHGATLDMQKHFGAGRVLDTSLSEEGIIGRAAGLALAGLLPVPEIQFRKYADPAHEQITDLGTLRWRTAGKFAAPVVVRIPVGFGKKTGDPWHSLSAEAVYAHTLGWRIAYPSNAEDAVGLLRTALRGDDPTFFFEHRALLDTPEGRRPYPGDDYCIPFGKAATVLDGDELTVITWGSMVHRCEMAGLTFAGRIHLIDLRTIIPWDKHSVLESVRRTGKVLVVHEDTISAGFAGEIIATINEHSFTDLDAPALRLATPDIPIPFNPEAMEAILPSIESIKNTMEHLLNY